jgi:hypothetical protein
MTGDGRLPSEGHLGRTLSRQDSWLYLQRVWDLRVSRVEDKKIRLADIVFSFVGLTGDWVWEHEEVFEGLRSRASPDVVLTLHHGCPPPPMRAAQMVSKAGGARNIYLGQDRWFFELRPHDRDLVPERPPRQLLAFDRRFTRGDLYVSTDTPSERPIFNVRVFLFELMAAMLPSYDGLMVHASGIVDGARGIIFPGPSGAGKSTMAGLWQGRDGVRLLNDDRLIFRKQGGRWWAYPATATGELGPDSWAGVVMEAMFLVSHGQRNLAERRRISQAATLLLPHISLPSYDPEAVGLGLQLLDDLLHEVPVYELGFVPDEAVVDYVRDTVLHNHSCCGVTRGRS